MKLTFERGWYFMEDGSKVIEMEFDGDTWEIITERDVHEIAAGDMYF